MNELQEGQIYTLNNGETYDIIHEHFYDGSGSWCYEIVVMKDIYDSKGTKIISGDATTIDWEDSSIEEIRERGVLVGELGKTHFWDPISHRLEKAISEHCGNCGFRIHSLKMSSLPCCNDCGRRKTCKYEPRWGLQVRINCPHWKKLEET